MLLKLEQEPLACLLGQAKCIPTVRNTLTRCGVCIHAHGLLVPSAFPTRIRLTSFSLFSKCIPGATCLCIHLGLPLAAICRPAAVKSRPKIKVLHRQRNLCGARDGDSPPQLQLSKPLCRVQVGQQFLPSLLACAWAWFMVKQICWRP